MTEFVGAAVNGAGEQKERVTQWATSKLGRRAVRRGGATWRRGRRCDRGAPVARPGLGRQEDGWRVSFTYVDIVKVEPAHEAFVDKNPERKHAPFSVAMVLVLVDGQRIVAREHYRLKRDAVAALAKLPYAPRGMKAILDGGKFCGTQHTVKLGGDE